MPPRLRGTLLDRLPLVVVALMLAIGAGLELARFDRCLWLPKLPLAMALAVALARPAARATPEPPAR
jgi:hypothetical protein